MTASAAGPFSTTYNSTVQDGKIRSSNASWSAARGASNGDSPSKTSAGERMSVSHLGPTYYDDRLEWVFDTTALPADAVITEAHISFVAAVADHNDDTESAVLVGFNPTDKTNIMSSDFNKFGSIDLGASDPAFASFDGSVKTITLNGAGRGAITPHGLSAFGLLGSSDFNNTAPTGDNTTVFQMAESATIPTLEVTYTSAGGGGGGGGGGSATTPDLGLASSYAILASTYTNTTATTVDGDVGFTHAPAVAPTGTHPHYGSGAPYSTAGTDQGAALSTLAAEPCTFNFLPGPINLSTDTTHGTAGSYAPGVYCSTGAMDVGGPLTFTGSGTYIFRPDGALTSTTGSIITLGGASACNVFWTPTQATTLAANTTFVGTIIDDSGITVNGTTDWTGRALAFGGTVTTDTDHITAPTCTAPVVPSSGGSNQGTINVVKRVINDNGGTKTIADFPMFVNGTPVSSGLSRNFPAPADAYTVTETGDANYARTFSGDCDAAGKLTIAPGENKTCIVTNDDIGAPVVVPPVPPLIDMQKVPSPLALPDGPGPVTYTYTLRNVGSVPVTDITLVGDSCSPITLQSGDLNHDSKLQVNETWTYRCTTTISETHTNTVTTTGWANGISAVDLASATVVVGAPVVPPLIHVTKVPSPLTLPAGGGMVTYTDTVTNPGLVALGNVRLTDDKCEPSALVSGDTNGDSKLNPNETWVYTCRTHLTTTTANTSTASGEANGLVARDFSLATVTVAGSTTPSPAAYGIAQALASASTIGIDKGLSAPSSGASVHCNAGTLMKLADDGNPATQYDTAVYYCGADGNRYGFPNAGTYFSWYTDFSGVQIVSAETLASVPLVGNVTYRPGARMIKIESDPKVYAIAKGGVLRWVSSEDVARALYGADWNKKISDIPVSFFINYVMGDPITMADVM